MSDDDVRGRGDERRRLIGELELERNQLLRNVDFCRIRDIEQPFVGEWSVKDIVGHVASWEAEVIAALREIRQGRRPHILDFDEGRHDEWNADHIARKRMLDFFSVLRQLRAERERLLESLDEFSDEEVGSEASLVRRVILSHIAHDRDHWHEIAARVAGAPGVRRSQNPVVSLPEAIQRV